VSSRLPIASLHAEAPCDWEEIAALYGELARITRSPVVELNRASAVAGSMRRATPPGVRRSSPTTAPNAASSNAG
jgi:predicted RNA polymerase sigma factor